MSKTRIREIDVLRALAILLMIVFHAVYDLAVFGNVPLSYTDGAWFYVGKASAILFILLSGLSTTLGRAHRRRAAQVWAAALGVTLATYLFSPGNYVRFGILHFLGTGMLLYPLLQRLSPPLLTMVSTLILLATPAITNISGHPYSSLLLPLGIMPSGFMSMDYYPLFPWLSIFVLGVAIGKVLYTSRLPLCNLPDTPALRLIEGCGRHSLPIYLLHQPVLLLAGYIGHLAYSYIVM